MKLNGDAAGRLCTARDRESPATAAAAATYSHITATNSSTAQQQQSPEQYNKQRDG